MADELLRERQGHVELLTINRPEARNAINGAVATHSRRLDELTNDDGAWVVVLTGAGEKAFSAGMDLKAFASGDANIARERRLRGHRQAVVPQTPHRGGQRLGLAGGFEIVLSCDMVVAADHATFGIPEVKRGLFAAGGGLIRLPKRIPLAFAYELALTGDPVDANRASSSAREPGRPRR